MSSDNLASALIKLTVGLEDDVSLRIIRGRGEICVDQYGSYQGRHPPGRYVLQVERDGLFREKSIWLTPQPGVVKMSLEDFDLTYRSAAPLHGVRKGSKEKRTPEQRAVDQSTAKVPKELGQGSEIFLFIRAADVSSRKNPARNIRLYSLDGELLADLRDRGSWLAIARNSSWASARLTLNPGNYVLRCHSGARLYDRIITAGEGFQTQVFLTYGRTDRQHWGIDPAVSSVLTSPLHEAFKPENRHSRLADLMLRALEIGEFQLERHIISDAMAEKIQDPMLGVYLGTYLASSLQIENQLADEGGRLAMSSKNRDRAVKQIDLILQNVAPRFSENTDLKILAAWFDVYNSGSASILENLELPPMLAASWCLARETELSQSDFVVSTSLAFRSALAPLSAGPWFAWRPMELRSQSPSQSEETIPQDVLDTFMDVVKAVTEPRSHVATRIGQYVVASEDPNESLADIYQYVREVTQDNKANEPAPVLAAKELKALSRYTVVLSEHSKDGLMTMRDRVTGATISPANGVMNLSRQLRRSLPNVISSLKSFTKLIDKL